MKLPPQTSSSQNFSLRCKIQLSRGSNRWKKTTHEPDQLGIIAWVVFFFGGEVIAYSVFTREVFPQDIFLMGLLGVRSFVVEVFRTVPSKMCFLVEVWIQFQGISDQALLHLAKNKHVFLKAGFDVDLFPFLWKSFPDFVVGLASRMNIFLLIQDVSQFPLTNSPQIWISATSRRVFFSGWVSKMCFFCFTFLAFREKRENQDGFPENLYPKGWGEPLGVEVVNMFFGIFFLVFPWKKKRGETFKKGWTFILLLVGYLYTKIGKWL